MNLDNSILTERADAALATRAANDSKFRKVIWQWLGSQEFLALFRIAALGVTEHVREIIFEEGDLLKVLHRLHQLTPFPPPFLKKILLRIVAFLFGIQGELA